MIYSISIRGVLSLRSTGVLDDLGHVCLSSSPVPTTTPSARELPMLVPSVNASGLREELGCSTESSMRASRPHRVVCIRAGPDLDVHQHEVRAPYSGLWPDDGDEHTRLYGSVGPSGKKVCLALFRVARGWRHGVLHPFESLWSASQLFDSMMGFIIELVLRRHPHARVPLQIMSGLVQKQIYAHLSD